MNKITPSKEWLELVDEMKKAEFSRTWALTFGLLCKQDEHALKMAKFIRQHQRESFENYLDKAYEIIGEPRPEYYVDGKKV